LTQTLLLETERQQYQQQIHIHQLTTVYRGGPFPALPPPTA